MNSVKDSSVAKVARSARVRRDLGETDYRRAVLQLYLDGHSQLEIARAVGIAEADVSQILQRQEKISLPAEGFSGADPFEICQRYSVGLIDRTQLLDELERWPWRPRPRTKDLLDDLLVYEPGTTTDLELAETRGLIDIDLYEEIAERISGHIIGRA